MSAAAAAPPTACPHCANPDLARDPSRGVVCGACGAVLDAQRRRDPARLHLGALDALCLAHAAAAGPAGAPRFDASAADAQRAAIAGVRSLFAAGALADGAAAAAALAPAALADARFQLDLRLHVLAEHVAAAARDGYGAALAHAREELAPFAEGAFPDAYRLFAAEMLLLVFPDRVGDLARRRERIADRVAATLRARLGARGSRLSFLVRYLVAVHCGNGSVYAAAAPGSDAAVVADAVARLVDAGRRRPREDAGGGCGAAWAEDPRPLPHESSARDFSDLDLLALCDRLPHQTLEASVDTMRYAGGSVDDALLLELARIRLDDCALTAMVDEYLLLRGLRDAGEGGGGGGGGGGAGSSSASSASSAAWRGKAMRRLRAVAETGTATQLVEAATQIEPALLGSSPALHFRIGQAALVDELRAGSYGGALQILRSKLGPLASEHADLLPALRETAVLLAFPGAVAEPAGAASPALPVKKRRKSTGTSAADDGADDGADEVHVVVRGGREASQIDSIRASVAARISMSSLAAPIYRAVGKLCGEPLLSRLLVTLLETHANWLAASGMPVDQFGDLLGINELGRDEDACAEAPDVRDAASDPSARTKGGGSAGGGREDPARAQKILTLREFLSLSRAEALSILNEHPSLDVNAIIEMMMGG